VFDTSGGVDPGDLVAALEGEGFNINRLAGLGKAETDMAIARPAYQDYVARAQVTESVGEVLDIDLLVI